MQIALRGPPEWNGIATRLKGASGLHQNVTNIKGEVVRREEIKDEGRDRSRVKGME